MKINKNLSKSLKAVLLAFIFIASILVVTLPGGAISVGESENWILVEEWRFDMHYYMWGLYGSSPAIADLGSDVNNYGDDSDFDLEIVTGSDETWGPGTSNGVWRTFDSQGNLEWQLGTQTDEARSSPVIIDLDGDGNLEISGGTTSGWYFQVMNHQGNFVWTFPKLVGYTISGPFAWPSSPAAANLDSSVDGVELVIGNRWLGNVWAFDGDNSDGIDEGITISSSDYPWMVGPLGTEGTDWDVLWKFPATGNLGDIFATPAIGDVDNDGDLEVVIGAPNSNVYVLNGATGVQEHVFSTGGAVYASAALADLDSDGYLEIVIGSIDSNIYCFEWDGLTGSTEWTFSTGASIYSSAAIGDIDDDCDLEIVIGSLDWKIYSLSASGAEEWSYTTGGMVYSSPALANRAGGMHKIEWGMFRNNPMRTGSYNLATLYGLDVYVGSEDKYLYLLDGNDGSMIDRFLTHAGGYTHYQGIHTSPSIADVDGDYKLEIFFYDWGTGSSHNGHTFWALEDTESGYYPIYVDIKPGSCPNPINLDNKGVLPVAICGTEDFDVTTIDPSTILLTREGYEDVGVSPLRWSYEDVATPYSGCEECGCHDLNGDGYLDLTLKFKNQEVVNTLELENVAGGIIPLIITGNLVEEEDGIPIWGQDCVWILANMGIKNMPIVNNHPIYQLIDIFLQRFPLLRQILSYIIF